ncbi:uncharacterized protein LOC133717039 [Rosa rugosa]|uniref:uncharacterized protein LOC133717039 n=1 Tax=Rosa rugosa TaxID=74645 RepID=UPI002B40AB11|nr:uncharacterized protein LOC133717039 [Rosa rugosa]
MPFLNGFVRFWEQCAVRQIVKGWWDFGLCFAFLVVRVYDGKIGLTTNRIGVTINSTTIEKQRDWVCFSRFWKRKDNRRNLIPRAVWISLGGRLGFALEEVCAKIVIKFRRRALGAKEDLFSHVVWESSPLCHGRILDDGRTVCKEVRVLFFCCCSCVHYLGLSHCVIAIQPISLLSVDTAKVKFQFRPSNPRFASVSRVFTHIQPEEDLKSLFASLAAQSHSDGQFIYPSVFQVNCFTSFPFVLAILEPLNQLLASEVINLLVFGICGLITDSFQVFKFAVYRFPKF